VKTAAAKATAVEIAATKASTVKTAAPTVKTAAPETSTVGLRGTNAGQWDKGESSDGGRDQQFASHETDPFFTLRYPIS
jgi:hypothetical protein